MFGLKKQTRSYLALVSAYSVKRSTKDSVKGCSIRQAIRTLVSPSALSVWHRKFDAEASCSSSKAGSSATRSQLLLGHLSCSTQANVSAAALATSGDLNSSGPCITSVWRVVLEEFISKAYQLLITYKTIRSKHAA